MNSNKKNSGFTSAELLISISIFLIIITVVYLYYDLSQKAYREGEKSAEITQNGRVILERLTREIRQAKEIVTELSSTSTSATSTIEFEDGHATTSYRYIVYYKENNNIERKVIGYYFSGDTEQSFQPWDAVPPAGQTLKIKILEEPQVVGEWVSNLGFWGAKVINISLNLEKKGKTLYLETEIFGRNF